MKRALYAVLIGLAPAVIWLAFATVYYGFPLPNTYYAKVANGIPKFLMYKQGFAYLLNSANHDPITLATIALALAVGVRTGGAARRAAISAALYVIYTVSVGGDFMNRVALVRGTLVTVTWNEHVAVCFFVSCALQVTFDVPTANRLPVAGVQLVDTTPFPPLAVGFG